MIELLPEVSGLNFRLQVLASAGDYPDIHPNLIDTANRPQADAAQLAREMDARYMPLPRADARKLSRAVRAATAPA